MMESQAGKGRWIARIAIALAAAILVVGLGLNHAVQNQISCLLDSIGANVFQVTRSDGERFTDQTIATLTSLDEIGEAAGAGSTRTGYAPGATYSLTYFEVSAAFADVLKLPFVQGQSFEGGHAAVLGYEVAQTLYSESSPIGEILEGLEIVGVLERIPAEDTVREPLNRRVLVPLGAAPGPRSNSGLNGYSILWVRPSSSASSAISAIIREVPNAQVVRLSERYAWAFSAEIQANRFLLLATASLVLLASIVVAGTLSLSSLARRWEIGVRMAIGARRIDVLTLLLRDSARLTVEGGALGIVAGVALVFIAEWLGIDVKLGVSHIPILPALALLGVVSGFLPAVQASRLYPAQALAIGTSNRRKGPRLVGGTAIVVLSSAIVAGSIYVVLAFGASTSQFIDGLWGDVDNRTLLVSAPRESILSPPELMPHDLEILESHPDVALAVSAVRQRIGAIEGSSRLGIALTGVGSGYEKLRLLHIDSGRDLTETDILDGLSSVVLSSDIAREVFGDQDAVGRTIVLDGRPYAVVGVFSSHLPVLAAGMWMVAPQASMRAWEETLSEALFWVRLADDAERGAAIQDLVSRLREQYPDRADVRVTAPTQLSDQIREEAMRLVYLLGVIAGATALLGAADIFNLIQIQLELRRMELAIRRAVGATCLRIAWMGVVRGLQVAVLAMPIGLALGIVAMSLLASSMAMDVRAFSRHHLGIVSLVFIFIGAASGGAAGLRTSRGTPAEALRRGRT